MTSANGSLVAPRQCQAAASRSADARGALPPGHDAPATPPGVAARVVVRIMACVAGALALGALASSVQAQMLPPAPTQFAALDPGTFQAGRNAGWPDLAASPRSACLLAAREAEAAHGLPEGLLVAIALSESGLHAHALNIGGRAHFPEDRAAAEAMLRRAGGRSVMAGCVQVNAGVHARGSVWPLDAVRATEWAAQNLRRWYLASGSWTAALTRWHGGSPAGTRRLICRVRAKLEVTAPGSDALSGANCAGRDQAMTRRSGRVLLELAEAHAAR